MEGTFSRSILSGESSQFKKWGTNDVVFRHVATIAVTNPHKLKKRSHVKEIKYHHFPKDTLVRQRWVHFVNKGRHDFTPGNETYVCSNHFVDGHPTNVNPFPTLFMCSRDLQEHSTPVQRKPTYRNTANNPTNVKRTLTYEEHNAKQTLSLPVPMQFAHLSRQYDVRFYTGLTSTETFRALFDHVEVKARVMSYWQGPKSSSTISTETVHSNFIIAQYPQIFNKPGPSRKLSIEQELLLTLMRLRLGLLIDDLAFRFQVSSTRVLLG